ncbi:MAG: hypothetical protein ACUVTR_05535 [Dehalococcoidia bacterium]
MAQEQNYYEARTSDLPFGGKGRMSKWDLSSLIKETTTGAEVIEKAATSNKERQLLIPKQAGA